ncbi:restriction endonuclease [Mucilaginibacter lappiensis]|uniref:Restriction system protein n=1 Tax=Mucilaginibacter lappiensis TaxID=354630 RepID=A0A841JM22_9SPHI|nr:restriction endonuclease [Mucilaginibacter lappiensis]MBB6131494.1 restriction system protein [Mucilaginibacter lappiensis]
MNYLKKIDPYVFEELLLEAFVLKGYKIKRNGSYSGDGGIDGIIYNEKGETILIQAKRYKSFINTQHLRDFDLLTCRQRVKAGYFIHTGRTPASFRYVFSADIQIISGSKLIDLVLMVSPKKNDFKSKDQIKQLWNLKNM